MDADPPEVVMPRDGLAYLPSFPLPALPDAPQKSTLALQGLSQSFLDAEIVPPSKTIPVPSGQDDGNTKLSEKMRKRLLDLGISELFAVQTALLPFLIAPESRRQELYRSHEAPRDVCVSAPTGSGKTLAYALPIVEILSSRIITRLRALIVVPTRDLVGQARELFEALCKGTTLKIGTATGAHSFAHEQSLLANQSREPLLGGSSKVDILICTPGRLIDHLVGTPNFTLQHLRFLVIDEADRLLAQSFQDWLNQVLGAIKDPLQDRSHSTNHEILRDTSQISMGLAPHVMGQVASSVAPSFVTERPSTSCQKLLFSATLTRDPGKIALLGLRSPKYFMVKGTQNDGPAGMLDVAMEKFSIPSTLTENWIVIDTAKKPLLFFYLVHTHGVSNALVFTKSAESTTRLVQLFELFEGYISSETGKRAPLARAYSSDLTPNERKTILEQFKSQQIDILVCSDLISRGLDISHVSHVVSYDTPVDIRKYVHRVGRTARAGRTGTAWTLVEEQEAKYFKAMMQDAGRLDKMKKMRASEKDLTPFAPHYEAALEGMKVIYTRQISQQG